MALLAVKINGRTGFGIHNSTGLKYANIQTATRIFLVVCVILIARQLSIITWQMLPSVSQSRSLNASYVSSSHNQAPNRADMWSQLNALHLFGLPPEPNEAATVPINVPVSRMAAKITGLVASSNPEHSFVILRRGASSETYRIGEQLKGSRFRIESIDPDRVIIRNGGELESLLMYPDEKKNDFGNQPGTVLGTIPSSPVGQMQNMLADSPASLAEIISITPEKSGSGISGYRIKPGKNRIYFDQLGLKSNDIAVALNGYDLTNIREAMKVLPLLSTLKQASLTIIRDGQRLDINLSS